MDGILADFIQDQHEHDPTPVERRLQKRVLDGLPLARLLYYTGGVFSDVEEGILAHARMGESAAWDHSRDLISSSLPMVVQEMSVYDSQKVASAWQYMPNERVLHELHTTQATLVYAMTEMLQYLPLLHIYSMRKPDHMEEGVFRNRRMYAIMFLFIVDLYRYTQTGSNDDDDSFETLPDVFKNEAKLYKSQGGMTLFDAFDGAEVFFFFSHYLWIVALLRRTLNKHNAIDAEDLVDEIAQLLIETDAIKNAVNSMLTVFEQLHDSQRPFAIEPYTHLITNLAHRHATNAWYNDLGERDGSLVKLLSPKLANLTQLFAYDYVKEAPINIFDNLNLNLARWPEASLFAVTPFRLTNFAVLVNDLHLPQYADMMLFIVDYLNTRLNISLLASRWRPIFYIIQPDGNRSYAEGTRDRFDNVFKNEMHRLHVEMPGAMHYQISPKYPFAWLEAIVTHAKVPLLGIELMENLAGKFGSENHHYQERIFSLYNTLNTISLPSPDVPEGDFFDELDFIPTPPHVTTPPYEMHEMHQLGMVSPFEMRTKRLIDSWEWKLTPFTSRSPYVGVIMRDSSNAVDVHVKAERANEWIFGKQIQDSMNPPIMYTEDGEHLYDLFSDSLQPYKTADGYEHTTHHFRLLYVYLRTAPWTHTKFINVSPVFTEGLHLHPFYIRAGVTNFVQHPRYAMLRFADLNFPGQIRISNLRSPQNMATTLLQKKLVPNIYTESLFSFNKITGQPIVFDSADFVSRTSYYNHLRQKEASAVLLNFRDVRPLTEQEAKSALPFEPMFSSRWELPQTRSDVSFLRWGRKKEIQKNLGVKFREGSIPIGVAHVSTSVGLTSRNFYAISMLETVAYHMEFHLGADGMFHAMIAFQPETIGYNPAIGCIDIMFQARLVDPASYKGNLRCVAPLFGKSALDGEFINNLAAAVNASQNLARRTNRDEWFSIASTQEQHTMESQAAIHRIVDFSIIPRSPQRSVSVLDGAAYMISDTWEDERSMCVSVSIGDSSVIVSLLQTQNPVLSIAKNMITAFETNQKKYATRSGTIDFGEFAPPIYDFWPAIELPPAVVGSCFMTKAEIDSRDAFVRADGRVYYKTHFTHNLAAYVRQVVEEQWFTVCFLKRTSPLDHFDGYEDQREEEIYDEPQLPEGIVDTRPADARPSDEPDLSSLFSIALAQRNDNVSLLSVLLVMYLSLDIISAHSALVELVTFNMSGMRVEVPDELDTWWAEKSRENSEKVLDRTPPAALRVFAEGVRQPNNRELAHVPIDFDDYAKEYAENITTELNVLAHYGETDTITPVQHVLYILHNATSASRVSVFTGKINQLLHESLFIETLTSVPKNFSRHVEVESESRDALVDEVLKFEKRTQLVDGMRASLQRLVTSNKRLLQHEPWMQYSINRGLNDVVRRVLDGWYIWNNNVLFYWINLVRFLDKLARASRTEEEWVQQLDKFRRDQLLSPFPGFSGYRHAMFYLLTGNNNKDAQNLLYFQVRAPYGTSIYTSFYRNMAPQVTEHSMLSLARSVQDARTFRAVALRRILRLLPSRAGE